MRWKLISMQIVNDCLQCSWCHAWHCRHHTKHAWCQPHQQQNLSSASMVGVEPCINMSEMLKSLDRGLYLQIKPLIISMLHRRVLNKYVAKNYSHWKLHSNDLTTPSRNEVHREVDWNRSAQKIHWVCWWYRKMKVNAEERGIWTETTHNALGFDNRISFKFLSFRIRDVLIFASFITVQSSTKRTTAYP